MKKINLSLTKYPERKNVLYALLRVALDVVTY